MTRTMRPTSTKRENLCVIGVMLVSLGVAVVAALSRRRRLLSVGGLSLERPAPAGPLSVAEML